MSKDKNTQYQWRRAQMKNRQLLIATIDPFINSFFSHYTLMFSYHPGTESFHKFGLVHVDPKNPQTFWDELDSLSIYLADQGMVFVSKKMAGSPNQISLFNYRMVKAGQPISAEIIFNHLKTEFLFLFDTMMEAQKRRDELLEESATSINDDNFSVEKLDTIMEKIEIAIESEFPSIAKFNGWMREMKLKHEQNRTQA